MSIYDVFNGGSKPFDKAEWAQKQAQRKEAYELIDSICSEMMTSGDSFRQYLDVQSRFDRYSVANAILVSAQKPDAVQLKDYSTWKQNRIYVNKDANKIVIDASPVPFVPVDDLEMPAYYDSKQQTIFIKTGLSEEQLFVSMAKEVSAAVFDFKHNESRDASDFKSFCVAYMVSERYGVDTRGFSFDRLPGEFSEMDTQVFKGELNSMRDVLGEIQSDMYKSLEKNRPPKNKEQER